MKNEMVMKALASAQDALTRDSSDAEHEALLALVKALEEYDFAVEPPIQIGDVPMGCLPPPPTVIKTHVPTYNGKWLMDNPSLNDFDEPHVPVLVSDVEGLRVILGTHDYYDFEMPDIQIERRHNGWMLFLRPFNLGDQCGFVVMLDDGRSFVAAESAAGDAEIKMVDFDEAIAELDDIRPTSLSCAPTMIVHRDQSELD